MPVGIKADPERKPVAIDGSNIRTLEKLRPSALSRSRMANMLLAKALEDLRRGHFTIGELIDSASTD